MFAGREHELGLLEQSILNQGSTFVVEIPSNLDSTTTSESNLRPSDKTVLVRYGANVFSNDDGNEAIEYISKHPVDLVLMDFKMPTLDGLEATQVLREKGFAIPILLVTANAIKDEK